jgi:four helix bundle protein
MKDENFYTSDYHLEIVAEINNNYKISLDKRIFNFAVKVLNLLTRLPKFREFDVFKNQLSKSSTSIGANYEESQAGTYREFYNRIQICLREARETKYFLNILREFLDTNTHLNINDKQKIVDDLLELINEASQITKIFGSISSKVKQKL